LVNKILKLADNFSEFEKTFSSAKESGSIISHAWENYKTLLGMQYFFIIVFVVSSLISMLFPSATLGVSFYKETY
jgi:hypothetical protein